MSKTCTKAFGEIHNITETMAANRIGMTINMDASSKWSETSGAGFLKKPL
jgi:hypothetical protein